MKPNKVSQLVSFLSSDIESIEPVTINSAAGALTAYGGTLNVTSYYDETVTDWPINKRFLVMLPIDVPERRFYSAYPVNSTTIRGIYADNAASGSQLNVLDFRFKKTSAITVQHDLFNASLAAEMNLTIAGVPTDSVFIPCGQTGGDSGGFGWDSSDGGLVITDWSKTTTTNIRMTVSGASPVDDAIWPSQVLIPNGAL